MNAAMNDMNIEALFDAAMNAHGVGAWLDLQDYVSDVDALALPWGRPAFSRDSDADMDAILMADPSALFTPAGVAVKWRLEEHLAERFACEYEDVNLTLTGTVTPVTVDGHPAYRVTGTLAIV